jgi:hypothetical protein
VLARRGRLTQLTSAGATWTYGYDLLGPQDQVNGLRLRHHNVRGRPGGPDHGGHQRQRGMGGNQVTDGKPTLSVGAVLEGYDTESEAWRQAIADVGQRIMVAREGVGGPLRLNVVFHVPGPGTPNDFVGVRTGRFDKKASRLIVQAAVPEGPIEDRSKVVVALLEHAIDAAEEWASKQKVSESLVEIRSILSQATEAG